MRSRFGHLVPLADAEIDAIWTNGIVTVDASVLLDVYRYDQQARDALLEALEHFRGRIWISHQAATEFFRNRNNVIASAAKAFGEADQRLQKLAHEATSVGQALGHVRPMPSTVVETLTNSIHRAIRSAQQAVESAKQQHPDYFDSDPLLSRILALFDGALGAEPDAAMFAALVREAEDRIKNQIPPGYLDAKKGIPERYGDYFLWAQVLAHAAGSQLPMILVTSEQKDDWWEKHNGRTLGPRKELLDDAARIAGQRILLYQRQRFLTLFGQRFNRPVAGAVIQEIRSVQAQSSASALAVDGALDEIAEIVLDPFVGRLVDVDEQITSLIGGTNASGFYADQLEIVSAGPLDLESASFPFRASVHYAGEQDEDRVFTGNEIVADIAGTIGFSGSRWEVVDYEVSAEQVEYEDDDDE